MCEQVPDGKGLTLIHFFSIFPYSGILKFRNVSFYRIIQLKLAFIIKHHQRCCCDGFRHGVDPKDCILFNWTFLLQKCKSKGGPVNSFSIFKCKDRDA